MKSITHVYTILILLAGLGLFLACGDDRPVGTPGDIYPPAPILDLSQVGSSPHSVTIEWTAPGDDSLYGIATTYEIHYSQSYLDETIWNSVMRCCTVPVPDTAGCLQSWVIEGLDEDRTFVMGVRAIDENGNRGALSNIITVRTSVDANGQFAPRQAIEVGRGPTCVLAGDLDNDGDLDLVSGSAYTQEISVCINRGDGRFRSAENYDVGRDIRGICFGDFNGDTRLDIAAACTGDDNVVLLRGRGNGEFDPMWTGAIPGDPHDVAAGDFNHDGYCDLAVITADADSLIILFGNAVGRPSTEESMAVSEHPYDIAVLDINDDSFDDLVIGCYSGSLEIWQNGGHGLFSLADSLFVFAGIRSVEPGDLDGDGDLDLSIVGGIRENSTLLNDGQGSFAAFQTASFYFPNPTGVAHADFDLDGDLDFAISSYVGSVYSARNSCDGRMMRPVHRGFSEGAWAICTGDFDGDGDADMAAADYQGEHISVFFNNQIDD